MAQNLAAYHYDEHGGCYDHVAPSAAVPPQPPVPGQTFGFDRYGVRVPAVIASPYVAPGTILGKSSAVPFDHTAFVAAVRKRFGISGTPTARDALPPDLGSVLTLLRPTDLGTLRLKARPCTVPDNGRDGPDQAAQFHAKGAGQACCSRSCT